MAPSKIKLLEEMIELRRRLRSEGKRVAFTNGCFDILHLGHVRYLTAARALADALIVGINSDRSVRECKGEGRPVVPEGERTEVLAALEAVDFVVVFDEATPGRIIDALVPDVLVKGADWEVSRIVGRETVERAGGSVQNIPLVEGSSTSAIVRTILERFGPAPH
jgi:D-beta-D-heptose 7-phosphate kinase/D-beta-D-heptose 1-phosphate adenosyltransferase